MRCARVSASSSTGHAIRSRPVAPGRGLARRDRRPTPRWSSASSAMRRYVVSLPPATLTIPEGPVENTVSRRAFAVPPSPTGSTRRPQNVARTGPSPSTAAAASRSTCSTSASVTVADSGPPSWSVSVVPSSSIPSHGTAKLTRTLSCGIVSAAPQSPPPSTSAWTPLLRRTDGLEPVQASAGERRVEDDAGLHEPRPVRPAVVEREEEGKPPNEMRRDHPHEQAPLVVRLADEPHVAEPQVPEPAVDQLRGGARRRAAEVALVDERDVEPVRRRRLGDAGADDPAADHQQVELPRAQPLECVGAGHESQIGFVHARPPFASATSTRTYGTWYGHSSRAAVIPPAASRATISEL